MKRNCLISIVLIAGSVLLLQLGCQKQAGPTEKPKMVTPPAKPKVTPEEVKPVPDTNQASPKITFEDIVYDFGEVTPGTSKVGGFKFTNTGQGPLEITDVKSCCGCSTNLDKKQYAAGESGELKVECHFAQRPGAMSRQLHVSSNDKASPEVTLSVKANIVTKITYEPQSLSLSLKDENAGCPEITITSLDNKPFSIKEFKSTADCITADVNSSVEATKFVIKPKVDVEKLRSNLNGSVEIMLTHPDSPKITIAFSTLPRFKVNPPVIIVFNASPQQPVKRDIWVLNNYGEEFKIGSTSSQNGIIKVLNQEKITDGYQLQVEITPPAIQSNQKIFTDVFMVNIEGNESLGITCRGFYSSERKHLPERDTHKND